MTRTLGLWALLLAATACSSRHAIFVQSQHWGLELRSQPETASPVDLEVGYDHQIVAYIPKRTDGPLQGEACSLFSKDFVEPTIDKNAGSGQLLRADAAIASGTAAMIAAIPDDKKVTLKIGTGTEAKAVATFTTKGDAVGRIATALWEPSVLFNRQDQKPLDEIMRLVDARSDADAVYAAAAALLHDDFQTVYKAQLKIQTDAHNEHAPKTAFHAANTLYLPASVTDAEKASRNDQARKALTDSMEKIDG